MWSGRRHRWNSLLAAVTLLLGTLPPAFAQDGLDQIIAIARGGLFYDNWYEALEIEAPSDTHPAYPSEGGQSGAATWRCKECHGWDYRGVDGAYGQGSHYTGIKGIRDTVGGDPASIAEIIRNPQHGYSREMLTDSAVEKLAAFVSRGQIDMDQYIDRATKEASGSASGGFRQYRMVCSLCHGPNGKRLNFGTEDEPEFLGTIANDNPWEVLHKIRNGQPGVPMIALSGLSNLSVQHQVDILAYTRTLPIE